SAGAREEHDVGARQRGLWRWRSRGCNQHAQRGDREHFSHRGGWAIKRSLRRTATEPKAAPTLPQAGVHDVDTTLRTKLRGSLSHVEHADVFVEQNRVFSELLRDADETTPVPTCPGWTLRQLLRHVGRGDR